MSNRKGNTLDSFAKAHDKSVVIPTKIQAALDKLSAPNSEDEWLYEIDFMKLAQICITDLARYRPMFEDYVVTVGGKNSKRVWFGTKALAEQARSMV